MNDPQALIDAYIDGVLDDAGFAELCDWLRADAAHRRTFARAQALHAGMAEWSSSRTGDMLLPELESDATEDWIETLAALDNSSAGLEPVDRTDELARRKLEAKEESRHAQRAAQRLQANADSEVYSALILPKPIIWLGLAAALGLAAWVVVSLSTPNAPSTSPTAQNPSGRNGAGTHGSARVARLTGSVDARWEDGVAVASGDTLYAGQTLRLASGFVELTTEGGATLVLEGPCEFAMLDAGRFTLAHGRVGVENRDTNTQLTVQTPGGEVVHTHASYGLAVGAQGEASVVCYDGRVELFSLGGRDATPDPFVLHSGRAAVTTSGDLGMPTVARSTSADTSSFVLSLSEAQSPEFLYRRAVLSSKPVAYWTFEEDVTRGVPNIAQPGTHDLRSFGHPQHIDDGKVGAAARLNNLLPPYSYFETAGEIDTLHESGTYTLEFWFKAERHELGTLANFYTGPVSRDVQTFATLQLQDEEPSAVPGWRAFSVRGLHRDPPGSSASEGVNVFSASEYKPDIWHHVVLVKTGSSLRLYVDGELAGRTADPGRVADRAHLVIGALARVKLENDHRAQPFSGLIDELAVYDRAVTAAEVTEHWRAGAR